jgi:hypothetical protein
MAEIDDEVLRALFDVAVSSMDFGSGFLDDEEVVSLRRAAEIIGVDPAVATPQNFRCKYRQAHRPQVYLDTPFFDGLDGVPRNAFRLTSDYPEEIQGKLEHPGGGGYGLGLLRAKVITTWCPDCGRRFDTFEDTSWRG